VHDSQAVGIARIVAKGKFVSSPKTLWVKRYIDMRESVRSLLRRYLLIEAVGVEAPPFGELWSEGLYGLFLMVNEAIWSERKDVVFFDPGTVKMLTKEDPTIRKGKMFKSDMVEAVRVDTGLRGRLDHNEADAYHIARYAARFWMLLRGVITEADLTPSEYRAFAKIHTFQRGPRAGQEVKLGAIYKENHRFFRFSQWENS
jgi:hypothetical protein